MKQKSGIRLGKTADCTITYLILLTVAFIFFFPCLWLILASFSSSGSIYSFEGFFPTGYSLDSFKKLFTDTAMYDYPRWFRNSLFIATMSCILGTFLTILTAYCMSRFQFKSRNALQKILHKSASVCRYFIAILLLTQVLRFYYNRTEIAITKCHHNAKCEVKSYILSMAKLRHSIPSKANQVVHRLAILWLLAKNR